MAKCNHCNKKANPLKRLSGMLICVECEENAFRYCEVCGKKFILKIKV